MRKNIKKIHINALFPRVYFAHSIFSKALGLMFRKNITNPLIFTFKKEKYIPLHMFFVFTPIDVLFLNSKKEVIEIKKDFKPFTTYYPKKKAQYVIEFPKKSITKHNITLNTTILWTNT